MMLGGLLVVLGACSQDARDIARAESVVAGAMRDPGSVRFENVRLSVRDDPESEYDFRTVCGLVNAKNGFGGYAGLTRFIVLAGADFALIDGPQYGPNYFNQEWAKLC